VTPAHHLAWATEPLALDYLDKLGAAGVSPAPFTLGEVV